MTPSSLLIILNRSSWRGLVNISANCNSVEINSSTTSLFSTWSLIKWCLISMCLVLECWIGFFVKLIALVLSHLIGILHYVIPKSSSYCLIHNTWAQQLPTATYSASAVDKATKFGFLQCHEIKFNPRNWHVPLVLFLSIL